MLMVPLAGIGTELGTLTVKQPQGFVHGVNYKVPREYHRRPQNQGEKSEPSTTISPAGGSPLRVPFAGCQGYRYRAVARLPFTTAPPHSATVYLGYSLT